MTTKPPPLPRVATPPPLPHTVKPPPLPRSVRQSPRPSAVKPPPLPLERTIPDEILSIIFLLAKLAKTDGIISQSEIATVDAFFRDVLTLDAIQRESAIDAFKKSKDSPVSFEEIAIEFRQFVSGNTPLLLSVIDILMAVSLADGPLNAREDDFIKRVATIFDVRENAYTQYIRQRDTHERPRKESSGHEKRECMQLLGLEGDPTPQQIKKAYRDLVVQCHPDRIQHLGPRLRELAEMEMKRINHAYDLLSREGVA